MIFAILYNLFDIGSLYFSAFVTPIISLLKGVTEWLA